MGSDFEPIARGGDAWARVLSLSRVRQRRLGSGSQPIARGGDALPRIAQQKPRQPKANVANRGHLHPSIF
ncbi:hypothetical protein A8709_24885 [Paenibacillus pectinilyticus]|uniref:Uncharacterized protein n=1 Tax=Paenibacillus pectinilyticus TaxID=512399 RepID=A0A1C1A8S3_9BACL|nr:hypothetical protein A8709_24885 [Paenibacillus pectinilyticus]